MHTKIWLQNLKGRDHLEDQGVDGRIILEWILGGQCGKVRNGFICVRTGTMGGWGLLNTAMNLSQKAGNILTR